MGHRDSWTGRRPQWPSALGSAWFTVATARADTEAESAASTGSRAHATQARGVSKQPGARPDHTDQRAQSPESRADSPNITTLSVLDYPHGRHHRNRRPVQRPGRAGRR